jgi:hypothetical protein
MQLDWLKLIPALVLLLTPISLFHGRRVRFRAVEREWQGYWARTLGLGLHTIDLGRAALGAWLLFEAAQLDPELRGLARHAPVLMRLAVLTAAILLQTLPCREPEAANAPFAFAVGLALGALPPVVALFALVLALVLAAGASTPAAFFPLAAISVTGLGVLFEGMAALFLLATVALALVLPWLVTLLARRHFVTTYRAQAKGKPSSPLK